MKTYRVFKDQISWCSMLKQLLTSTYVNVVSFDIHYVGENSRNIMRIMDYNHSLLLCNCTPSSFFLKVWTFCKYWDYETLYTLTTLLIAQFAMSLIQAITFNSSKQPPTYAMCNLKEIKCFVFVLLYSKTLILRTLQYGNAQVQWAHRE